jgi:HK97 family phage portal protein
MGLFSRFAGLFRGDTKSLTEVPVGFRWPEARTGYQVSALSSLEVSTVMACVRAISEGCAQVPVYVHTITDRGEIGPRIEHPVQRIFTRTPNEWQSGFEFRETLLVHMTLVGNAFVYISRRSDGSILELIPIEPGRVLVTRERDMSLTYRVTFDDGTTPIISQRDMWHIRGPSWNTWMGLDAVKLARESIGLAVATEAAHATLHKNGVSLSGLYSMQEKIGVEKFKQISAWLDQHSAGGERQGKPLILDQGAKYQPLTMTGVDAQHIETRKHQVLEICRHMRVNPMIVGASETPTYASAEQMFTAHVVHTLQPNAERIEQSANRILFGANERVELRHDFNGMMRGDSTARANYYAKALGAGGAPAWLTQNEIRADEGRDPIEGGDELPKPTNVAPQPAQAPDDELESGDDNNDDHEDKSNNIVALFKGIKRGMAQ